MPKITVTTDQGDLVEQFDVSRYERAGDAALAEEVIEAVEQARHREAPADNTDFVKYAIWDDGRYIETVAEADLIEALIRLDIAAPAARGRGIDEVLDEIHEHAPKVSVDRVKLTIEQVIDEATAMGLLDDNTPEPDPAPTPTDPANRRIIIERSLKDLAAYLGAEFPGDVSEMLTIDTLAVHVMAGFFPEDSE